MGLLKKKKKLKKKHHFLLYQVRVIFLAFQVTIAMAYLVKNILNFSCEGVNQKRVRDRSSLSLNLQISLSRFNFKLSKFEKINNRVHVAVSFQNKFKVDSGCNV